MPEVSLPDWNKFLHNFPDAHILQTGEWGELKAAFGWDVARLVRGQAGAQVLFRKLPFGFTVAYLPKPVFSKQPLDAGFRAELDAACRKRRAIFLKIEPDCWEDEEFQDWVGSVTSPHNIQPPRTVVVDLGGSEEDVLARMKQKCRYNVRLAEKKGIIVRAWDDLPGFHRLMLVTGSRDGFGVHSLEYYQRAYDLFRPAGLAELLVAEFEGKPLAALMGFAFGKRSYYLYGASTDEERNRMPTYLLQWEAMRWARSQGCESYDLWGVPDEDETDLEAHFEQRHDGLWGVYRFKRGFGGQVRRAAQASDIIYNKLLYKLYLWRYKNSE